MREIASPSVWQYVGVWILVSIISNLVAGGVIIFSFESAITQPAGGAAIIAIAIGIFLSYAIYVGIYDYFRALNKERVIMWMWIFSAIGALSMAGSAGPLWQKQPLIAFGYMSYPLIVAALFQHRFRYDGKRMAEDLQRYELLSKPSEPNDIEPTNIPTKNVHYRNVHEITDTLTLDFNTAAEIFPQIKATMLEMKPYGRDVQREYMQALIDNKNYTEHESVAKKIIDKYMEQNYGQNVELKEYAKALILKQDEAQLARLKNYIRVIGADLNAEQIVNISKKEQLKKSVQFKFINDDEQCLLLRSDKVLAMLKDRVELFETMLQYRQARNHFAAFRTTNDDKEVQKLIDAMVDAGLKL